MWDQDGKHYFIFELTGLSDGRVVIPLRWIIRGGKGSADAVVVTYNPEACFNLFSIQCCYVNVSSTEPVFLCSRG